ncbi:MAG: hypothetical protein KAW46_05600 [candidate division Zixibacteria bacterium]|nr:hypothetical protein [candidate division Zixibacteria bacterium]
MGTFPVGGYRPPPTAQIARLYEAKVKGHFVQTDADRIASGIKLEDGTIGRARVRTIHQSKESSRVRLILTEGRKREVKQLCKAVGHPVLKLKRLEFAAITTTGLAIGKWRELTAAEVKNLKQIVGLT